MKLCWISDPHLDHYQMQCSRFFSSVAALEPNAVVISGDIAESSTVETALIEVSKLSCPIYYTLGNHDYYGSSIASIRALMQALVKKHTNLRWLTGCNPLCLTPTTCVIGHDGWYDCRNGNYVGSTVALTDFYAIDDLVKVNPRTRMEKFRQWGTAAADHIRHNIKDAIKDGYKKIVIVTHVAPFPEVSVYRGKVSDPEWLPYFSCKAMGTVIQEAARVNKGIEFLVLSGHSHGRAEHQRYPNLLCLAAEVEYGKPSVEKVLEL